MDLPKALEGFEPVPSVITLRDQGLRDTCITRPALGTCKKWEIAVITGHDLGTIDTVLKHYFGLHPELARSAIKKLNTYVSDRS